jgi:uncharacterized integral membrane protein (TIGR00698 family)
MQNKIPEILIPLLAVLCFFPFMTSPLALVFGIAIALIFGNPHRAITSKYTKTLLSLAVIGLGAGMNLITVGKVGLHGILYTIIGISFTLGLGKLVGKFLKIDSVTSLLVTVGTAICGGSAIAAVSPVVHAKTHQTSVALGIVFTLNALALVIFPILGHHFLLTETQFGLWSALAIHDTSSVVGSTLQYGPTAVQVGTTVKLARALWIVPLTLVLSSYYKNKNPEGATTVQPKKPWFILGFLAMAAVVTFIPSLQPAGAWVELLAKRLLVLTLFLIGLSLDRATLKSVGIKPFVQGVALWVTVASLTLMAILQNLIH